MTARARRVVFWHFVLDRFQVSNVERRAVGFWNRFFQSDTIFTHARFKLRVLNRVSLLLVETSIDEFLSINWVQTSIFFHFQGCCTDENSIFFQTFDRSKQDCCNGNAFNTQNGVRRCCGRQTYDSRTQECCNSDDSMVTMIGGCNFGL